jgi:uncharacterized repeat protein (TIGR01451 family)
MFKGTYKFFGVIAVLACGAGSQAFAQEKGCIALKSVAEIEQEVVDAKGAKTTKLVPAAKVVPGTVVIWTVTANNICKQPSEKVSINNSVPEHMTFVPNSAIGPGADITYSLDGKAFDTPDQLTVQENGAARKARSDEYKHIRWAFKSSLAPGTTAHASFRAVLN